MKDEFSKEDLQKSYKLLVKKYHPDSNPKNQDWSHKKMTEINLAYETCCNFLNAKKDNKIDFKEESVKNQEKENVFKQKNPNHFEKQNFNRNNQGFNPILYKNIKRTSLKVVHASEIFFEYGLENRKIRYEGVRRFRYRESLRSYEDSFSDILELEQFCQNDLDQFLLNLYIRFTGNLTQYIHLKDAMIPRHPLLNRHWQSMEDHLIYSLKDYLVPYQISSFKKIHWKTGFTYCWNQLKYLRQRFPRLENDDVFLIFHNLADSYSKIRKAEEDCGISFF
ncbi:J domain-containing protein [Oceanispirochaeta crateris]|uniref:J domain-containing protein n=1 Tax=Oceanispirochaeta crateris TaxID=2518645 RepID=UPI00143D1ABB|nr:J domain-containing protein [Oceanispirochaeta crateris]